MDDTRRALILLLTGPIAVALVAGCSGVGVTGNAAALSATTAASGTSGTSSSAGSQTPNGAPTAPAAAPTAPVTAPVAVPTAPAPVAPVTPVAPGSPPVTPGSPAPVLAAVELTGAPSLDATVGAPYSFQPSVVAGGGTIVFDVTGLPTWARFDKTTGALHGSPGAANTGHSAVITITATNGSSSASIGPFEILVNPAPTGVVAPTPTLAITGVPTTTLAAGQAYRFQPSATVSGTQKLTFSILNRPSWATFSVQTGELSGTPNGAQAQRYSDIVISVSDGITRAALPAFALTVTLASSVASGSLGSATLQWSTPTANTDGSPLADLAGYHIHYGDSASALTELIDLNGSGSTTYVVNGLKPGTYFFAVSAFTSAGTEGSLSNVASKTL